jgi:pimeloyl-ACP methyl ester carboxylesterase
MTTSHGHKIKPGTIGVGDVSLFVDVVGQGHPLVLMHGGPSADLWTMSAFRQCADQSTLVFDDHRCNGRSDGPPVSSMTWENLTADARRPAREAGLRAVGRTRPLVRRTRGARVRARR